jgi:hypothetical protein
MRKRASVQLTVITQGYTDNNLDVRLGPTSCGDIKDGVSFAHGNEGSWVMDFKDLEAIYYMADLVRRQREKA